MVDKERDPELDPTPKKRRRHQHNPAFGDLDEYTRTQEWLRRRRDRLSKRKCDWSNPQDIREYKSARAQEARLRRVPPDGVCPECKLFVGRDSKSWVIENGVLLACQRCVRKARRVGYSGRETLGRPVKELRKSMKMTQQALADDSGMTLNRVRRLETPGEWRELRVEELRALLDLAGRAAAEDDKVGAALERFVYEMREARVSRPVHEDNARTAEAATEGMRERRPLVDRDLNPFLEEDYGPNTGPGNDLG